tara:strand:+ start:4587 stop:5366 length:780 start_codon:yes stop_codon:yes gene_type:complete
MKTAVYLSGFTNRMQETYPYLKKYILDPLQADLFFFGYENDQHSTDNILETYQPIRHSIRKFDKEIETEIYDRYLASHDNAKLSDLNKHITRHPSPIPLMSQFYNLLKCNELKRQKEKEENFTYDVVIRIRSDMFFCRSIKSDIKHSDEKLDTHIFSNDSWDWLGGYTDAFAFGNSKNMDTYCSFFDSIAKYILDDQIKLHPETLLKHHFTKTNLVRHIVKPCWWWSIEDFSRPNPSLNHAEKKKPIFEWRDCSQSIIK